VSHWCKEHGETHECGQCLRDQLATKLAACDEVASGLRAEVERLKVEIATTNTRWFGEEWALRTEIERLKAQLLDVKVPYEHAQRLAEEVERLRAALKQWGQHESTCDQLATWDLPNMLPCNCRIAAALAGGDAR
jgi:uncharacterized small protein (DUF1192 family)